MSEPRRRFRIDLEALPSPVPAARRLAQALKHLLRAHNLKCTSAVEICPEQTRESNDNTTGDPKQ